LSKPIAAVAYSFAGSVTLGVMCHFQVNHALEEVPVGLGSQRYNLGPIGVSVWDRPDAWPLKALRGCDAVFGAPPCHGFAMCNTARGGTGRSRGVHHPDNVYMKKFAALVVKLDAKVGAFDMVPGFFTTGRPILEWMVALWERHGYATTVVKTEGMSLGLPSRRRRLAVIAHQVPLEVPMPNWDRLTSGYDAISDLVTQPLAWDRRPYATAPLNEYQRSLRGEGSLHPWARLRNASGTVSLHDIPDHRGDPIGKRLVELDSRGPWDDMNAEELRALVPDGRCLPGKFAFRVRTVGPSGCVTSSCNIFHPTAGRNMTAREHARLMSYPDWYEFAVGQRALVSYAEIAKAMPPIMAEELAGYVAAQVGQRRRSMRGFTVVDRTKMTGAAREWIDASRRREQA